MTPAFSRRRTRSRQARGLSATRSDSAWLVRRPSRCRISRICRSMRSSSFIGADLSAVALFLHRFVVGGPQYREHRRRGAQTVESDGSRVACAAIQGRTEKAMALFDPQALNPGVTRREVFAWACYDFANS